MFLPQRRIRKNDYAIATEKNSGYFVAFIPHPDHKTFSTVVDHSSNLIAQGYSYNPERDTWEIWVGSVIRTYRRYNHA